MLTAHLLELANAEFRRGVTGIAPDVLQKFQSYAWPGNVRQLANVLRHAVAMAENDVIQWSDLPEYLLALEKDGEWEQSGTGSALNEAMATTERRVLEATLARFQGSRTLAAEALGISRKTLYNKLHKTKPDS